MIGVEQQQCKRERKKLNSIKAEVREREREKEKERERNGSTIKCALEIKQGSQES